MISPGNWYGMIWACWCIKYYHVCMYVCMYVSMRVCICVYIYISVCVCGYVKKRLPHQTKIYLIIYLIKYEKISTCICIYIYVCVCAHIISTNKSRTKKKRWNRHRGASSRRLVLLLMPFSSVKTVSCSDGRNGGPIVSMRLKIWRRSRDFPMKYGGRGPAFFSLKWFLDILRHVGDFDLVWL